MHEIYEFNNDKKGDLKVRIELTKKMFEIGSVFVWFVVKINKWTCENISGASGLNITGRADIAGSTEHLDNGTAGNLDMNGSTVSLDNGSAGAASQMEGYMAEMMQMMGMMGMGESINPAAVCEEDV